MPTLAEIRDAIHAKLANITNVGQVHKYERYTKRIADFVTLYQDASGEIRGWNIRRTAKAVTTPGLGRYVITNTWRISGYVAIADEAQSELSFDDLIESIMEAFKTDESLGGVVDTIVIGDIAGMQLEESGPVKISEILCHSCRLSLQTRHYE